MRYPEATVGAVILNSEDKVLICKIKQMEPQICNSGWSY